MNKKKLLFCKNLAKSYERKNISYQILKDVSFSIKREDIIVILGKSGSGKSTLLQLLAGLDYPNNGAIFFKGKNINKFSETEMSKFRNQNIGFIYQFHHLLSNFTVLENIMLPLLIYGIKQKKAKKKSLKLINKIGLKNKIYYYPNSLSGGEKQRVAIARSFINKPSLILADEPTGNLDPKNSNIFLKLLLKLKKENKTSCLIATHDLNIANKINKKLKIKNGYLNKIK